MNLSVNARNLRFLLIGLVIVIAGIGISGFMFSYSILKQYTLETSELNAQAELSSTNVMNLRRVKQYLDDHKEEVQRARDIVAESKQYQYQDDIVRDISTYASQSGVAITAFSFSSGSGAASAPTAGAAQPATQSAGLPATQSISGLKATTADITIRSPVGYTNILNFIRRIERSPMKMQIASVSLSKADTATDVNSVATQSFTIEVYIR